MGWISDPNAWAALLTLTVLEIVLGIDNIIFISHSSRGSCRPREQAAARNSGLFLAMFSGYPAAFDRLGDALTEPLFTIFELGHLGPDLILAIGGLFLIVKSTHEIHETLEGDRPRTRWGASPSRLPG